MTNIIVKNYTHFNKALPSWDSPKGRYISSKKQYVEECKKAGLVPYSEPHFDKPKLKPSKDTLSLLSYANSIKDKKGNVKLSDRAINKMIEKGIIKDRDKYSRYLPKHYSKIGGFC